MLHLIPFLEQHNVDFSKTFICLDFEDTLVYRQVICQGKKLKYIYSSDAERTYRPLFGDIFACIPNLASMFPTFSYEYVEPDIIRSVVSDLQDRGAHIGICSNLESDHEKRELVRRIGIVGDCMSTSFASSSVGKAFGIVNDLAALPTQLKSNITTVVLIDNSQEPVLTTFSKDMKIYGKVGGFAKKGLNISTAFSIEHKAVRNGMEKYLPIEARLVLNEITPDQYDTLILAEKVKEKTTTAFTATRPDGESSSSTHIDSAASGDSVFDAAATPASTSISLVSASSVAAVSPSLLPSTPWQYCNQCGLRLGSEHLSCTECGGMDFSD
jgi:hypothetical protein